MTKRLFKNKRCICKYANSLAGNLALLATLHSFVASNTCNIHTRFTLSTWPFEVSTVRNTTSTLRWRRSIESIKQTDLWHMWIVRDKLRRTKWLNHCYGKKRVLSVLSTLMQIDFPFDKRFFLLRINHCALQNFLLISNASQQLFSKISPSRVKYFCLKKHVPLVASILCTETRGRTGVNITN